MRHIPPPGTPGEPTINSLCSILRPVFRLATLANGTASTIGDTTGRLARQKTDPQSGAQAINHRFPGNPQPFLSCKGQATVEYLIVGVALIAIIVALGMFSGRLQEGLFVQHAADSASHALTTNTAGSAGDILLY